MGATMNSTIEGPLSRQAAYVESEWSMEALCRDFDIPPKRLSGWLINGVEPRKENAPTLEKIMKRIGRDTKKIPYHPSFGYATPPQIEKLNSLGLGPERDYLLAQIQKQNESGGKTKF